jgi:hypothetical protein
VRSMSWTSLGGSGVRNCTAKSATRFCRESERTSKRACGVAQRRTRQRAKQDRGHEQRAANDTVAGTGAMTKHGSGGHALQWIKQATQEAIQRKRRTRTQEATTDSTLSKPHSTTNLEFRVHVQEFARQRARQHLSYISRKNMKWK